MNNESGLLRPLAPAEGLNRPLFHRIAIGLAVVLGVALLVNGVVMLMVPFAWYKAVPGVMETGPFNQHLVRDIALLYALIGGALITGAVRPVYRVACWGTPTLWLTGHAIFHFWEIAVGICGPAVIPRDFPAVTMPALIGLGLTLWAWREQRPAVRHRCPASPKRASRIL